MAIDLTPPLAVRLAYQNSQMATGTYFQGGSQVFSHLTSPPATGTAAETASDTAAQAVGTVLPVDENIVLVNKDRNIDRMRNGYDSASGNHV